MTKALKTKFGLLVAIPIRREEADFLRQYGLRNSLLITKNSYRRITNLVKLRRFEEAEHQARILASILRTWDIQQKKDQQACLKQSAPAAPQIKNLTTIKNNEK